MSLPLATSINAFHVIGGCFAVWALILGFLGATRPDFPGNRGGERVVLLVSLTLMVATVSAAIVTSKDEKHKGGEHKAAPAAEKPPAAP